VPYYYRLLPKFRVAAEAVNRDLKAAAKILSALVACSIPFNWFWRWAQAMDDRGTIALCGNRSTMRYRQPTKYRFQRRCELVERFQERNFLTVGMTVGKMDEGGRRAQNQ
jgi:hypothetical protein